VNSSVANTSVEPSVLCKLSEVQAGVSVTIKQLTASPELSTRLREMGFCEEQRVRLLSRNPNLICQVCNARLGLSSQLAGLIWVERTAPQRLAA
jgi:Fe2+ transport system protein FeoA